jgi:hypothetical protein
MGETAVEWIEKKLKQNCGAEFTELNKQIFDKAKEIEKLHIQRAFVASKMTLRNEEQYYNQTFLMNKPN